MGELVEHAVAEQRRFDEATSASARKERGHFGTPAVIAAYMAGMFSDMPKGLVRILDPGAGVGTLSAAVCDRILALRSPRNVYFELWENDSTLAPVLRRTMQRCQRAMDDAGHRMEFAIRSDDFILANTGRSLLSTGPVPQFEFAILNPPYFKLRKESPHARAMEHVVHGQPNIYALFMALAADLLLPGGEMVAITPRSYFNGPYFKRFRRWYFDRMTARQIHVFESRTEAFRDDAVLQENVILMAERGGAVRDVKLTNSTGRDLTDVTTAPVAYRKIIDASGDRLVRVTTNQTAHDILEAIDRLPSRFDQLGFKISTGPVVTFRSTEFLRVDRDRETAPLLWMHNVRPFVTRFPPKNGKPTHIVVSAASKRLLVPARRYVLLKRFTAKEEKRRLVAGIMDASDSYSPWVGLENHLNYVYRWDTELSEVEAFGLAAYFNSAVVDGYFRAISGSTQVNANEIRGLPMPDERTLTRIGEAVLQSDRDERTVEKIVGRAIKLPRSLMEQMTGAGQ